MHILYQLWFHDHERDGDESAMGRLGVLADADALQLDSYSEHLIDLSWISCIFFRQAAKFDMQRVWSLEEFGTSWDMMSRTCLLLAVC